MDSASAILIANSKEGNILKFDTEGNLLLKTGRFGQAPGEFEFPSKVYSTKSTFFVLDSLRSCIQIFDKNGVLMRRIKLFRSYIDFCINSQGYILAARGPKDVSDYLVDALDVTGNPQFSFGSPIRNAQVPLGMANKTKIALNNDDNVIVIFQTSARLQKYDKNGLLLKDIQLNTEDIARDLNYNKRQFRTIQRGKRVGYHHIIESIRIIDDTYYVLRNGEGRIEIFEIDVKGNIGKSYYFAVSEDYYAIDFDLIRKSNELTFYILETTPECLIEVYSTK